MTEPDPADPAEPAEPDGEVLLVDVADRVATLTMHRPHRRNALDRALQRRLREAVAAAEADDGVDVIILTGTDPAFCAGLDLKELGSGGLRLGGDARAGAPEAEPALRRPLASHTKPVIGAVNGPAITGGFELALACDFLVASERAAFADTHARIGVMPGWGLTVLLPEAVGIRRAREMSTTGNFVDAATAASWGLVNHVVPHDDLLPFCRALAADIVSNDQDGVRQMLDTYRRVTETTREAALVVEAEISQRWLADRHDPAAIEARRHGVVERGRGQRP